MSLIVLVIRWLAGQLQYVLLLLLAVHLDDKYLPKEEGQEAGLAGMSLPCLHSKQVEISASPAMTLDIVEL